MYGGWNEEESVKLTKPSSWLSPCTDVVSLEEHQQGAQLGCAVVWCCCLL